MTFQKLFNKAVYKSALKRCKVGSILYFIIIFMITSMVLIFTKSRTFDTLSYFENTAFISCVFVSICASCASIFAVFKFLHSKEYAIFFHSLPVTRTASYISSLSAALTLLIIPVISNFLILCVLSFASKITLSVCTDWCLYNIFTIFVMASVSVFSAFLMGKTTAGIIFNIALHYMPLYLSVSIGGFASYFIFGYQGGNVTNFFAEYSPLSYLFNFQSVKSPISVTIYILISLFFYGISLLLYKHRHIENTENIVSFYQLKTFFVIFLTFLSLLGTTVFFENLIILNPVLYVTLIILITAIVYFGFEMILEKTVKIQPAKITGYFVFIVSVSLLTLFISCTDFFGYETRIPLPDSVEYASIYQYEKQNGIPKTQDKQLICEICNIHKDITRNRPFISYWSDENSTLYISYKMKNGKTLTRSYIIKSSDIMSYMDKVCEQTEYKRELFPIFNIPFENLIFTSSDMNFKNETDKKEFIDCIKKDLLSLPYNEIFSQDSDSVYFMIDYISGKNKTSTIDICINSKFKNTKAWLKSHPN